MHTDHGDVPIENIHEGDEVESRNRATGKLEYQQVTALTPPHQDSLVEMRIEGEGTPLRPTIEHPFWVKRADAPGAWIAAGEMRTGDFVQSIAGAWRRVVAITPVERRETVYNFTVDKDHDYFVGETGFLVHNRNCGCDPRLTKPQQRQVADFLGMKEVNNGGFPSQGQPVFATGGRFFTFSNTMHLGGEVFKEFSRRGKRIGTCDLDLNVIGD